MFIANQIGKVLPNNVGAVITQQLGGGQVDFQDSTLVVEGEVTNRCKIIQVDIMGLSFFQF